MEIETPNIFGQDVTKPEKQYEVMIENVASKQRNHVDGVLAAPHSLDEYTLVSPFVCNASCVNTTIEGSAIEEEVSYSGKKIDSSIELKVSFETFSSIERCMQYGADSSEVDGQMKKELVVVDHENDW